MAGILRLSFIDQNDHSLGAVSNADYSVFSIPEFDANEYANAVLAGDPYPPTSSTQQIQSKPRTTVSILEPAKEDISVAISKLDLGIEDISKQIKALVRSGYVYSGSTH
jgi:hypothetical protein